MGTAILTSIIIAVALAAVGLVLGASVGVAALAAVAGTLFGVATILLSSRAGGQAT